ncbi:MAG: Serine/threonine protein kinase PrkC, regulator of stationary phase [Myxococcaceae bacterium]|nr:Serine/threonine protein kinase PrkC, regulator of stationary phase [Myxococcaceae bacterium]
MLPSDEDLQATIERAAPLRATFESSPRATIELGVDPEELAQQHALAVLESIAQGREGITLEKTLGEGGMGIVRLGWQSALRRRVAVKTLRDEARDPRTTLRLLREAWITGTLEHPNVVPVHDLSADERGGPRLVMKRIEGVEWAALMHDAAAVEARFAVRSLLDWNLSIFQQVANAIAFAHARGIVHRDVKPDNVMIGAFGEVYVVDWGIAVATRDDGSGLLPLAADAVEMTGTPAYMAPEMLGLEGARITERTDVYLLGAVLYELLHGHPPHRGDSLAAMIHQIARSQVAFADHCPDELVRICRRALEADPDARFETVVQLRLAVQGYLQHRGAMTLCEEAAGRAGSLRAALAEGADREALYGHFGAARFGYQQSLRAWKENGAARDALSEITELMVEHELASGDPGAASTLVADLHETRPALVERVAAAKRARDAEHARLARQAGDYDPNTGTRTRTALGLVLGVLWTALPLLQHRYGYLSSAPRYMVAMSAQIALLLALGRWARDTLRRTAFNRRVAGTVLFAFVAQFVLAAGAWLMPLPLDVLSTMFVFVWFVLSAHVAIVLDRRIAPMAVGYLVAFLAAARWPEWRWVAMSLSSLALTLNVVAVGAPQEDVQASVHKVRDRIATRVRAPR